MVARSSMQALVTGAAGFVGSRVVPALLRLGVGFVRCGVRRSSDMSLLEGGIPAELRGRCQIAPINLLSREECDRAVDGVELIYHLVAGRGKSFPGCFQGSVITTRNLLHAALKGGRLRRFVNVSSFAVYSNFELPRGAMWDESCRLERALEDRHDAYVYGKLKQEELVEEYHRRHGLPYVHVRPGIVFGPGKKAIPGFVGMDTFGFFMHLGGGGRVPLTYVENCAEAIALAGLVDGIEGEALNVVDDELPTSRAFLRAYKRSVRRFWSLPVPYPVAYGLCSLWEWYARTSKGQLPPVFNRRSCAFAWKGNQYSNQKAKQRLGWRPRIPMREALNRYFAYQRSA